MKQHTIDFKNTQISLGKEQNIILSYGNTTLTSENINSFTYSYESNMLKSIMTCIELETTEDIPLNTKFNLQYGLKVGDAYEYLNFNNYIVYSSEKQEEKASYRIIAYDEMLDTMKDYQEIEMAYPCTIADFIEELATELGYTYTPSTFPNYNQQLNGDYFKEAGYTYRDVLDDLAEVTASNIVIRNGELIIAGYNETHETFDDNFIKTTNADFKSYGPINSVVLSRSISDNIYAKDQESIDENGLWEIKISDNQIMNNINRDQYIMAIYNKLHGMTYTLCDFETVGIGYLEPLDTIVVRIGDTTYNNVILFNDEYKAEDGISERIHVDEPIQSQTDYKKADTTDQRINQTNLIVDKQAQTITGIITNVGENTEHISTLTQTVDGFSADIQAANTNANEARQQTAKLSLDVAELRAEIGDIIDITVTEEGYGTLSFEDINQSEPITVVIHASGRDIKALYPSETLYPGATLYPLSRSIIFENLDTNEKTTYYIPDDLLWYSTTVYDELLIDYDTQTCQITKRVGVDEYGQKYPLIVEQVVTYDYPYLPLADGDYSVYTPSYESAYLKVRLMHQNPYVTQFATRAEMNSAIQQSATEIESRVALTYYLKEEGHTLESRVTQTESDITSEVADRTQADSQLQSLITQNASSITAEVTARQTAVNGLSGQVSALGDDVDTVSAKVELKVDKSDNNQVVSMINASANRITLNSNRLVVNSDNFKVAQDGTITATNGNFSGTITSSNATITGGKVQLLGGTSANPNFIVGNDTDNGCWIIPKQFSLKYGGSGESINMWADQDGTQFRMSSSTNDCGVNINLLNYGGEILFDVSEASFSGKVYARQFIPNSKAEIKKDIKEFTDNPLDIINNTKVYEFNYKQNPYKKKSIGFVIGKKYNISNEVTDDDENGINMYNVMGILWKAVQEQQQQIEQLKKEIEELKK